MPIFKTKLSINVIKNLCLRGDVCKYYVNKDKTKVCRRCGEFINKGSSAICVMISNIEFLFHSTCLRYVLERAAIYDSSFIDKLDKEGKKHVIEVV